MSLINVTDQDFTKEVEEANGVVLVDFWAPWCGPCQSISLILEKLHAHLDIPIKIVKINTDNNPETPLKYGVRSIPTLVLLKDGCVISQKSGSKTLDEMKSWILQDSAA